MSSPQPGAGEAPTVVLEGGTPAIPGELGAGARVAGRYTVVRRLGAGGMGTVYEATDDQLGVRVAIKTVQRAGSDDAIRRFKREIQLARAVTHPNVCRIYDLELDESGQTFLTMELLDGETLAERLRRGPVAEAEALPFIDQICAGLAAAHAAGVVHRDLKASNVMLVERGGRRQAVITDFGLALTHRDPGETGTAAAPGATAVAGTPAYMAPEQAAGKPATPAADVFSLGVIIAEMIAGAAPFSATTKIDELTGRDASAVTPAVMAELPERWRAVVARCLAHDPADRFEPAGDVATALRPPAARRSRLLLVALAGVAVAGFAGWWLSRDRGPATAESPAELLRQRATAEVRAGVPLAALLLLQEAVAVDPDLAPAWVELARAHRALGHARDAEAAARRAVALAADGPRGTALAAEAQLRMIESRWPEAIGTLGELHTLYPEDLDVGLDLAEAQLEDGRALAAAQLIGQLRASLAGAPEPRLDLLDAWAAERRGDTRDQRAAAERALAAAHRSGSLLYQARAHHERARAALDQDDLAAAAADIAHAERLLRGTGHDHELGLILQRRARVEAMTGQPGRAEQTLGEALRLFEQLGDRGGQSSTLTTLFIVLRRSGRTAEGEPLLVRALAIQERDADYHGMTSTLINLGNLAYQRGDLTAARDRWARATVTARQVGDKLSLANALGASADVAAASGDLAGARAQLLEAIRAADAGGAAFEGTMARLDLAALHYRAGQASAAEPLLVAIAKDRVAGPAGTALRAHHEATGRPVHAAATICGAITALEATGEVEEEFAVREMCVEAALAAADVATARAAAQGMETLAGSVQDPAAAIRLRVIRARLRAVREPAAAVAEIAAARAELPEALVVARLEVGIALAQAQRRAGRGLAAAATAAEVARAARERGLLGMAGRAERAAQSSP